MVEKTTVKKALHTFNKPPCLTVQFSVCTESIADFVTLGLGRCDKRQQQSGMNHVAFA